MKRFALEFFLPPFLASLPAAFSTAWAASKGGVYSPGVVFLAFLGAGFALAAVPSLVSTILMETAIARKIGIHPGSRKWAGLWALFGLVAGVVVSQVGLAGDLMMAAALTYALAWGITGLLVGFLTKSTLKGRVDQGTRALRVPRRVAGPSGGHAFPH